MKTGLTYAGFLLCFWLVFVVVTLPAGHAWHWLQARAALPLELYQLDGSVWRGRAATAVTNDIRLGRVEWTVRPAALLRARIELDITVIRDEGRLETVAGILRDGTLYLRDASLGMPLDEIARLAGEPDMGLSGLLSADLQRVELGAAGLTRAEGIVTVRNAGLGAPMDIALGGFTLALTTDDDRINGVINDTGDGPLESAGTLALQPDGRWRIDLRLVARDAGDTELRQALALIGRPGAGGRVTVVLEGRVDIPGR